MITIKDFINKYYSRFGLNCHYNPKLESYKEMKKKLEWFGWCCSFNPCVLGEIPYYIPARQCGRSILRDIVDGMVMENVIHKRNEKI